MLNKQRNELIERQEAKFPIPCSVNERGHSYLSLFILLIIYETIVSLFRMFLLVVSVSKQFAKKNSKEKAKQNAISLIQISHTNSLSFSFSLSDLKCMCVLSITL